MSQINARAGAGNFLETLCQLPRLGVADGTIGCQINVTGDRGNFSQRIRLFSRCGREQWLTGVGVGREREHTDSGDCEEDHLFHILIFLFLLRRFAAVNSHP